jgi:hypothetical protein
LYSVRLSRRGLLGIEKRAKQSHFMSIKGGFKNEGNTGNNKKIDRNGRR